MRIFKIVHFNLPKKETPAETIARYAPVVAQYSNHQCDIKFFLEDSTTHKISHVDRVIKKHPALSAFRYLDKRLVNQGARPSIAMSNFDTNWMGLEDTPQGSFHDIESMYEILSGIPKRYALANAIVIYDQINFLNTEQKLNSEAGMQTRKSTPPYLRHFLSSSVVHRDFAWITGRIKSLKAIIEIPEYSEFSDYTKNILDSLCCDYHVETVISPKPCEVENVQEIDKKASTLISTYFKEFPTRSNFIGDLELKDPWEKPFDWNPVSQKKSLKDTFAKHKFKFEKTIPGHNIIPLSSKTPFGNRILLEFVFSNTYRNFQICITFQGKYWIHTTHFQISPKGNMEINDQETMDRVMLAALKCWQVVENEFIPNLDSLYGQPPEWLFDKIPKKPKMASKA